MPKRSKPLRTSDHLRQQIGDEIAVGFGRNEIARRHGVSPGLVSKIARERGLGFRETPRVSAAAHARQIRAWEAREDRLDELIAQYVATPLRRDGRPTKMQRRLSYAIYNATRHHNGTYGSRIEPRAAD